MKNFSCKIIQASWPCSRDFRKRRSMWGSMACYVSSLMIFSNILYWHIFLSKLISWYYSSESRSIIFISRFPTKKRYSVYLSNQRGRDGILNCTLSLLYSIHPSPMRNISKLLLIFTVIRKLFVWKSNWTAGLYSQKMLHRTHSILQRILIMSLLPKDRFVPVRVHTCSSPTARIYPLKYYKKSIARRKHSKRNWYMIVSTLMSSKSKERKLL